VELLGGIALIWVVILCAALIMAPPTLAAREAARNEVPWGWRLAVAGAVFGIITLVARF
jgi:hypothetical protein